MTFSYKNFQTCRKVERTTLMPCKHTPWSFSAHLWREHHPCSDLLSISIWWKHLVPDLLRESVTQYLQVEHYPPNVCLPATLQRAKLPFRFTESESIFSARSLSFKLHLKTGGTLTGQRPRLEARPHQTSPHKSFITMPLRGVNFKKRGFEAK